MVFVRTENGVRPLESRCNARKDGRILSRPDAPRIRTKNKKERGRKDNVKVIIIVFVYFHREKAFEVGFIHPLNIQ